MNDMKKNIRRVFWLYFGLFLMVVLYLAYFILVDSKSIVNSTYNPRLHITDTSIMRGKITDVNGNVLAESVADGSGYRREYPYNDMFAHVTGYIGMSKAGIEAKYNFNLQNLDMEIVQRINNIVSGSPLTGDTVHLTLDAELQKIAYDGLGQNKGGVVVMEPSTGKILAMVSYPAFNPNTIADSWETLSQDEDNSPLLNRATQGLYPPGSVFKIVTAAAVMAHMEDWAEYTYECTGEILFGDNRIRCYDSTAHGAVDLHKAIEVSCNTYFANALMHMGPETLMETAEKVYFNTLFDFGLERVQSRFSMDTDASDSEIMETSIGQGRTVVTPLHMAMITSAIANGGKMMEPYVSDYLLTKGGGIKSRTVPAMMTQAFTTEQSILLTEMMTGVVERGTGTNAAISGIKVAGKTGTAQNASGDDHGWFVAFAPADNPEIAVAVLTENTGGSRKSIAIARDIMVHALSGR